MSGKDATTKQAENLLPCPFCGGEAEMDTMRGYLTVPDGRLDNAVAIYCAACGVDQSICRADHHDLDTDQLISIVTEAWNKRTPPLAKIERAALPGREEIALARKFIAWWDTLPGGNNYSPQQVERWLNDPIIKELVSEQRATLSLPAGQERRVLVLVKANDYSYVGVLVSTFTKISGAIRCVVEDDKGRLFIHNPSQITVIG